MRRQERVSAPAHVQGTSAIAWLVMRIPSPLSSRPPTTQPVLDRETLMRPAAVAAPPLAPATRIPLRSTAPRPSQGAQSSATRVYRGSQKSPALEATSFRMVRYRLVRFRNQRDAVRRDFPNVESGPEFQAL